MPEAPPSEGDVADSEAPAPVSEGESEGPVTTPSADPQTPEVTASSPPAEASTSAVESPPAAEAETPEPEELPTEDIETDQANEEVPEAAPPVPEMEEESPSPLEAALAATEEKESPIEETPEKMPIPSVVIEPASSNEGDDDRDCDITSPIATSGNGVIAECQSTKDSSGMPSGFKFKVETMHDFDAANPDELQLKQGDIVLVVPTELLEDQDAGWLTGIRENDWLQLGSSAQKGLFPENFTQKLE